MKSRSKLKRKYRSSKSIKTRYIQKKRRRNQTLKGGFPSLSRKKNKSNDVALNISSPGKWNCSCKEGEPPQTSPQQINDELERLQQQRLQQQQQLQQQLQQQQLQLQLQQQIDRLKQQIQQQQEQQAPQSQNTPNKPPQQIELEKTLKQLQNQQIQLRNQQKILQQQLQNQMQLEPLNLQSAQHMQRNPWRKIQQESRVRLRPHPPPPPDGNSKRPNPPGRYSRQSGGAALNESEWIQLSIEDKNDRIQNTTDINELNQYMNYENKQPKTQSDVYSNIETKLRQLNARRRLSEINMTNPSSIPPLTREQPPLEENGHDASPQSSIEQSVEPLEVYDVPDLPDVPSPSLPVSQAPPVNVSNQAVTVATVIAALLQSEGITKNVTCTCTRMRR